MLVLFRIQRIKRSALLTLCISVVEVTASFTLFHLSFCALRLVESCWIPTLLSHVCVPYSLQHLIISKSLVKTRLSAGESARESGEGKV